MPEEVEVEVQAIDRGEQLRETGDTGGSVRKQMTIVDGKFFTYIAELSNNKKTVATCKKCEPRAVYISGAPLVSSNFIKHLKIKHGNEAVAEYTAYLKARKENVKGDSRKHRPKVNLNQADMGALISKFVVSAQIPFRAVEDPNFIKIFKELHIESYGLKVPSRFMVVKTIDKMFQKNNETLTNILRETDYVCATADIWSGKKRSFLGVTVHWFENNYERKSAAIACRRFKNAHTYIKIADLLSVIFAEFGLNTKKVVAVVTDNGSNFVAAFKKFGIKRIALQFEDPYVLPNDSVRDETVDTFSSGSESDDEVEQALRNDMCEEGVPHGMNDLACLPNHIRCCSHTLNLCAAADVKKLLSSNPAFGSQHRLIMSKCSELWHCASRPKSAEVIHEVLGHTLSGPGVTRWNSLFDSLNQVSGIRNKCSHLCRALKIKTQQCLSDGDFDYIDEYIECSKPLAMLLDLLQGEQHVYFGDVIPSLFSLRRKLRTLVEKDQQYCGPLAQNYLNSVETRFKEFFEFSTPIAQTGAVAAFAHPSIKKRWLKHVTNGYHDGLLRMFTAAVVEEMTVPSSETSASTVDESPRASILKFCDLDDNGPVSSGPDLKTSAQQQILNYFMDNSKDLTLLDKFATIKTVFLKTNVILPSSAPVERLFSFATMTNAPKSNRLSDKNFESRVILKANGFKF
ncbi:Hypothetical protein NTJ_01416 [Nesidiocoris tenuis]|nr:Hypothetical protein NTJ_01416 [Nesidiocoris tenuis]